MESLFEGSNTMAEAVGRDGNVMHIDAIAAAKEGKPWHAFLAFHNKSGDPNEHVHLHWCAIVEVKKPNSVQYRVYAYKAAPKNREEFDARRRKELQIARKKSVLISISPATHERVAIVQGLEAITRSLGVDNIDNAPHFDPLASGGIDGGTGDGSGRGEDEKSNSGGGGGGNSSSGGGNNNNSGGGGTRTRRSENWDDDDVDVDDDDENDHLDVASDPGAVLYDHATKHGLGFCCFDVHTRTGELTGVCMNDVCSHIFGVMEEKIIGKGLPLQMAHFMQLVEKQVKDAITHSVMTGAHHVLDGMGEI